MVGCSLNEANCSFAGLFIGVTPSTYLLQLVGARGKRKSVGRMNALVRQTRLGETGELPYISILSNNSLPGPGSLPLPFVFSVSHVPLASVFTVSSLHSVKPFFVLPSWVITAQKTAEL
jgi:hypothetical protein